MPHTPQLLLPLTLLLLHPSQFDRFYGVCRAEHYYRYVGLIVSLAPEDSPECCTAVKWRGIRERRVDFRLNRVYILPAAYRPRVRIEVKCLDGTDKHRR